MAEMMAVLEALMSSDNKARKAAESTFAAQLESNALATVQQLIWLFSRNDGQTSDILRSFAGVLLRRALEKTSFDANMSGELREMLLNMWKVEQSPLLLKRLAHIMAQSASGSSWLDLLPQVVENVGALKVRIVPDPRRLPNFSLLRHYSPLISHRPQPQ